MDRRQFLETATLAGVAGATAMGAASCAPMKFLPLGQAVENQPDMDAYLRSMDEGMSRISAWDPVDAFTDTRESTPVRAEANRLARNAYKALYVTAMFSDLSPDDQLHPGVQARMMTALPQIYLAGREMEEFVDGECGADADALREWLNGDDDPGLRFLEHFNGHARASGVTGTRCARNRLMTTDLLWRLKNQPSELVIDEVATKMRKLEASEGDDEAAVRHFIATRVSEEAFWRWQQAAATAGGTAGPEGASGATAVPAVYDGWTRSTERTAAGFGAEPGGSLEPQPEEAGSAEEDPDQSREGSKKDKPRRPLAQRAARQMGIGLLLLGVGGLVVAAGGIPGLFIGTVGAIFFMIGLLRLIVAGARNNPA